MPMGQVTLIAILALLPIMELHLSCLWWLGVDTWPLIYWDLISFIDFGDPSSMTLALPIHPGLKRKTTTSLRCCPCPMHSLLLYWKECPLTHAGASGRFLFVTSYREAVVCGCVCIHVHVMERQGQTQRSLKVLLLCVWKPHQKETYRGMLMKGIPSPNNGITQHEEDQSLSAVAAAAAFRSWVTLQQFPSCSKQSMGIGNGTWQKKTDRRWSDVDTECFPW